MKSQNNQLKSADIGHEFCVLTKTKRVGHDSNSILVPEFEFDHDILKFSKIQNFQNTEKQSKQIPRDSWSNSNSGTKIEWESCPTCLILVKTQNL